MTGIAANLQAIRARIAQAAQGAGRPAEAVLLLAISKGCGAGSLREAMAAGQHDFGENYVQEALGKIEALEGTSAVWHFTGPLQSNKTRLVATCFHWVHTIDRAKIAQRLSEQRDPFLAPLQVCLQVNLGGEASKSGVTPEELPALARAVAVLPRLTLRGLMAIPELASEPDMLRQRFAQLRRLRDELNAREGLRMDTLSMGMSADFDLAIAEGATIVRVGTAIFGPREVKPER